MDTLPLPNQHLQQNDILLYQRNTAQLLNDNSPYLIEIFKIWQAKFQPELFNGLEVYGHSGNAPGYAAACLYLPDYGICMGFTDNTEEGNAMTTIFDLLSVITSHLEEIP